MNIDNPCFKQVVCQIYSTELQLDKTNSFDTKAPFLDFDLFITNFIVLSKRYNKCNDFKFQNS